MMLPMIWFFLLLLKGTIASLDVSLSSADIIDRGKSQRTSVVSSRQDYCQLKMTTHCENVNNTWASATSPNPKLKCFGTELPYTSVSLDLMPNVYSLIEMLEIVESLEVIRRIPKCWAVVQPLICAFHLPKCTDNSVIYLPSQALCRSVQSHCKLLMNDTIGAPLFMRCSNTTIFPPDCKDNFREIKFNTSSTCPDPLVLQPTSAGITMFTDPQRHYPRLEGCNLPCETPLFSKEELGQLQKMIAWAATAAFLLNLFAVCTFLIDWTSASRYPALTVFYMNLCCMVSNLGWLSQFLPGARSDILCRKDGTARGFEPSMGENLSCVVVFVIVYYFSMAAIAWFMVYSFACYKTYKKAGVKNGEEEESSSYYHSLAWSCPFFLTVVAFALGEVHPDSTSGICFVGTAGGNLWGASRGSIIARWMLLIVPVVLGSGFSGFFLIRSLRILFELQKHSRAQVSNRALSKLQRMGTRLIIFIIGVIVLVILTTAVHAYEFKNASSWQSALDETIMCNALGQSSVCQLKSQPSLLIVQLHIVVPFLFSILAASSMLRKKTKMTWKSFLSKKIPCYMSQYYDDPRAMQMVRRQRIGETLERSTKNINVPKRKVIAKAYAKRGMLKNEGHLSFSYRSSHGDPVGMDFGVDSQTSSKGFSSSFANNLPRLLQRRGAFPKLESSNDGTESIASDVGMSFRQVSLESRRNSVDSQVSLTISEFVATRHQTRGKRSRQTRVGKSASRRMRHRNREKHSKWGSRSSQVDQVSQYEFHASQVESSRRCSASSLESQNTIGFTKFMQAIPPVSTAVDVFKNKASFNPNQRRVALTDLPSASLVAKLNQFHDSNPSDEEASIGKPEDAEMNEAPNHGPTIVEIEDDHPLIGRTNNPDSSDESSPSASSDEDDAPSNTMKKSGSGSTGNDGKRVNSNDKNDESDMSSSSDEETPFLEIVQVCGGRDSIGLDQVTKDMGVQVCLEKTRKKQKVLNKSFHNQMQTEIHTQSSSRSKSAGVC